MEKNKLAFRDGQWVLDPKPCVHGGLPEKLATAFDELFSRSVGVAYTPLVYCGSQLVHGTNYMIICKAVYTTAKPKTAVVRVVLHETLQSGSIFGDFSVLAIDTIVEEMPIGGYKLSPFPYIPGDLKDDPIHEAFVQVKSGFEGSRIEPLAFCGTQHVGPSAINHMFICSSSVVGSDEVSHIDAVVLVEEDGVYKLGDITEIV